LLGGPATFARDNATLNINVYNNNNNNNSQPFNQKKSYDNPITSRQSCEQMNICVNGCAF